MSCGYIGTSCAKLSICHGILNVLLQFRNRTKLCWKHQTWALTTPINVEQMIHLYSKISLCQRNWFAVFSELMTWSKHLLVPPDDIHQIYLTGQLIRELRTIIKIFWNLFSISSASDLCLITTNGHVISLKSIRKIMIKRLIKVSMEIFIYRLSEKKYFRHKIGYYPGFFYT